MARGTDVSGRLEKLSSALIRAKRIKAGTTLSAQPMAEIIGCSWVTLKGWCNDLPRLQSSKAFVRGGNGIEWQFKPVAIIEALIECFQSEADKLSAKNSDLKRRIGVVVPDSELTADLTETRQLIAMTLQVQAAEQEQGAFVPAEQVKNFLDGYNQAVKESILGVKSEIDPTGIFAPEIIVQIDNLLRAVALRVHQRCSDYIEKIDAGLWQEGTSKPS